MTSTNKTHEVITRWDSSWINELNKKVSPRLKGITFAEHREISTFEGFDHEAKIVFPSGMFVKIVINVDHKYFVDTLKNGQLDERLFLVRLEGFIKNEYGYNLMCRNQNKEIE